MNNKFRWNLREYQKRSLRRIVDAFDGKVNETRFRRLLLSMATGGGKTIVAAALTWYEIEKLKGRVMMLADTDELCYQTLDKIHKSTGIIGDMEKAEQRASREADFVVGSIQSLQTRYRKFPADHFTLVIADEAHMSMAPGWQRVLKYFGEGGAKELGITATPERGDKKSLMKYWEHVADDVPMIELIKARHLSPITVETVPLEIVIQSKITDSDSDDVAAELEAYYGAIIDKIEAHAANRQKVLIFHPSVPASKRFTELLVSRGHAAAHVDGNSPDRKEKIEGFEQGRFRFFSNCQILTKGYDCPGIDCIIVLRPVKSRTAYIQMVGRGTRLFCPHGCSEWCQHADRKQDMLVLDFLWSFADHDVMGPADLLTDAPEQRKALAKKLKEPGALDILSADEFVTSEREADLLEALKRNRGRRGSKVDALSFAALLHQPQLLDYEPLAQWHHLPVSPRQAEVLAEVGVDPESIQDRGHASALMDAVVARRTGGGATLKQVAALMRAGVENPHLYSFAEAGKKLDNIYQQH